MVNVYRIEFDFITNAHKSRLITKQTLKHSLLNLGMNTVIKLLTRRSRVL